MTKTISIAEAFLLNAVRSPGFRALNAVGGCLLVSLSLTGKFSLGRELLMIRESGFGTIFVLPFASSIAACSVNRARMPSLWFSTGAALSSGRSVSCCGFVLHGTLSGILSFLLLSPFLAAGLCLFHSCTASGILAATLGVAALIAPPAKLHSSSIPGKSMLFPAAAALVSMLLIFKVPEGRSLVSLWAFSILPVAMVSTIAGASCFAARGLVGPAVAIAIFLASNLRASTAGSGVVGAFSKLLPDVSGLNPSLLVSSGTAISIREFLGAGAYALLIMLAAAAAANGAASLKEEPA